MDADSERSRRQAEAGEYLPGLDLRLAVIDLRANHCPNWRSHYQPGVHRSHCPANVHVRKSNLHHFGQRARESEISLPDPVGGLFAKNGIAHREGMTADEQFLDFFPDLQITGHVQPESRLDTAILQAVEILFGKRFPVVITATGMPGSDGLEQGRISIRRRLAAWREFDSGYKLLPSRFGEISRLMPIPEMLGGDQQALQRAADADVQFPLVGVNPFRPARLVGENIDFVFANREFPGLYVVAGRRQHCIADQEFEFVGGTPITGKSCSWTCQAVNLVSLFIFIFISLKWCGACFIREMHHLKRGFAIHVCIQGGLDEIIPCSYASDNRICIMIAVCAALSRSSALGLPFSSRLTS